MKFKSLRLFILSVIFASNVSLAQEGIAVYTDYLADNLYLLHPSMAGASNCGKLRVTARQQWFDVENAPSLQTASFNSQVGDRSGFGIIAYNDRNGFHSQIGAKVSYAHHIQFSRYSDYDLNRLSFGISAGFANSRLDQTTWTLFDPINSNGIEIRYNYFNIDAGFSYFKDEFFFHGTIQNLINSRRELYSDVELLNLRKFIGSAGVVFGDETKLLFEPSTMFQYTEATGEKAIDGNLKVYKPMEFGRLWGGLSYRYQMDILGDSDKRLTYITPILGVNYDRYMFSYTYSHLTGSTRFDSMGFHQITLGIDLFCKEKRWRCNCPAVN
jgi:type IX secretion system PorP/SprF family membrane protein